MQTEQKAAPHFSGSCGLRDVALSRWGDQDEARGRKAVDDNRQAATMDIVRCGVFHEVIKTPPTIMTPIRNSVVLFKRKN
jgi:hypothetical protein